MSWKGQGDCGFRRGLWHPFDQHRSQNGRCETLADRTCLKVDAPAHCIIRGVEGALEAVALRGDFVPAQSSAQVGSQTRGCWVQSCQQPLRHGQWWPPCRQSSPSEFFQPCPRGLMVPYDSGSHFFREVFPKGSTAMDVCNDKSYRLPLLRRSLPPDCQLVIASALEAGRKAQ